jgi:hypothetical protein
MENQTLRGGNKAVRHKTGIQYDLPLHTPQGGEPSISPSQALGQRPVAILSTAAPETSLPVAPGLSERRLGTTP